MSDVLVGSSYALMQLRYEQFTQGVSIVDQQIARLQALSKTPITFQAQLGAPASGGASPLATTPRTGGSSPASQAQEFDRLQRAQAQLEATQARLARTQGDAARAAALEAQAEQRLTDVLSAQSGVTVQSIATERQLATVQQQSARASQQAAQQQRQAMDAQRAALTPQAAPQATGGGGVGVLGQAAGLVGVGIGAAQLVSFSKGALDAANSLDRTASTVRALSGSQARYNEVLEVARAGQHAYGGSLEESLRGLGTLVNLSNRAGVALGTLDNISRRLAIVDPVQGIEGANIALKEFLSGDNAEAATSLARRFELPRTALAALAQEGVSAKDRLAGLDTLLNQQGITTQVLTDRTTTQAAIYDRLGAAALNARDAVGALLAIQAGPAASSATGALSGVTQLITAYNDLSVKNRGVFDTLQAIIAPIQTYNNAVLGAGASVLTWAGALTESAPAAQAATQSASAYDAAVQAVTASTRQSADALSADAQKKLDSQIATAQLSAQQAQLEADSALAAQGLLGAGNQALLLANKYGIATAQAQFLINAQQQLSNATALADQRKGEQTGTTNTAAEFNKFSDLARQGAIQAQAEKKKADDKAATEAAQLQSARDNLALSRATTSAQKVAILRQQQARATSEAEKLQIQAQIEQAQKAGTGRVSAAQTTAQQLNAVEQNSGAQLLKTQRENQEKLARQEEDFGLRRSRAEEDYAEQRRSLLAHGQRAQAAQLAQEFAKTQRRAQEDFDIQKRRTLRDNAQGTGDIGARTDLRQSQIADRAALRGVRAAGGVDLGQAPPALQGRAQPQQIAQITIQGQLLLDGAAVGQATWPTIRVLVDDELSVNLQQVGIPNAGQSAVGGAG